MEETYIKMGSCTGNLFMPLALLLFLLLDSLVEWRKGRFSWETYRRPWLAIAGAFLVGLTPLPHGLVMAISMLLFLLSYPISGRIFQARPILSIPIVVAMTFQVVWSWRDTDRLLLTADDVISHDFGGRPSTIPRSKVDLEVEEVPQFSRIWGTSDLTIYTKDRQSWLSVYGDDVYWGPRGLVLGKDLGYHISKWAGVEPTVLPAEEPPGY